jgi:hypothetical protein
VEISSLLGKSTFFGPTLASRAGSLKSLFAFAVRWMKKTGVLGRAWAAGRNFETSSG